MQIREVYYQNAGALGLLGADSQMGFASPFIWLLGLQARSKTIGS